MALPTMTIRIAFGSDAFAAVPVWTTLPNTDVLAINTHRGRVHELDRIEAGTAMVVLRNHHGNYWPNNGSGLYSPNVLPMKRVNIRATYGGSTYALYTGFVESWNPGWLTEGGIGPIMTIECVDLISSASYRLLNNAGEAQELSGTRIGNVLDEIGWPAADRALDAGQSYVIATGAQANVNAMDHLFLVQESELGLFFIRGDGYAIFQDRHARLKAPYNTSQATFGDDPGEMKYQGLEISYDQELLYNEIRITRSGGTEQAASDATSIGDYGQRSLSRTGLLMPTDAEASDQAYYLLSRLKDPFLRAQMMTIYPQADDANLWPKVLNYDISTRITLRLDQASIDADYHIEGVEHNYDAREGAWSTTWELSPASIYSYWILGTSALGTETRVAY